MKNLKSLDAVEIEQINGGILPCLIVYAGYAVGVACAAAAGDIMLNFNSYSQAIDNKIDQYCK